MRPEDEKELNSLRRQIDDADDQLLAVLSERMELVRKIHRLKERCGLDLKDEAREQEILARLEGKYRGLGADLIRDLFRMIFKVRHGGR